MDANIRLTEQLADMIAADPSQALLLTTVKSYDEHTFHHGERLHLSLVCTGSRSAANRRSPRSASLHDIGG
jgi:hypothetical protein